MDKLYTIQEVATKLNLSDKTLRRWEEAGRFTSSRTLGNQRRYSIEDLQILDAIKHGTINEQKDLLTIEQAGKVCGVSPTTILRWENDGKIHPFITSGNTYYPRQKLVEKMEELKKIYSEPEPMSAPEPASIPQGSALKRNPRLQVEGVSSLASERTDPQGIPEPKLTPFASQSNVRPSLQSSDNPFNLKGTLLNALITIIILLSYHLLLGSPTTPVSPQTGSVQGASTSVMSDPRLDDLITKFQDYVSSQMLKDARPISTSTIKADNATLITGSATLTKGQSQISVPADKVTPTTPITVSFTTDFAPAKKYWVTANDGAFTVSTDFPVSMSSTFNYSYLAPTLTPAPSSTPSSPPVLKTP